MQIFYPFLKQRYQADLYNYNNSNHPVFMFNVLYNNMAKSIYNVNVSMKFYVQYAWFASVIS